jgi:alpha-D-ribose 1-methylphosphonate 5-triphosphate synthase subunit PhnL
VQNGYREGKCIETAVQAFIEIIQEALDKGAHTIGIFIDLTTAYDTLNHKVLQDKLSSMAQGALRTSGSSLI